MVSNEFYDVIKSIPDKDVGDKEQFKKAMWLVTVFYSQFKQKDEKQQSHNYIATSRAHRVQPRVSKRQICGLREPIQ